MNQTTPQPLEELLESAEIKTWSMGWKGTKPVEINPKETLIAGIQALVAEAIPEVQRYGANYSLTKKTTQRYIKEKIGETTGYNRAILEITKALQERGLL